MRHRIAAYGARMLALAASSAVLAACAAHAGPVRLAVQHQTTSTPTSLAAALTPPGWHHVADAEFDPSEQRDSRVGYGWTARSRVRWILSCETTKGTRPESIYFMLTSANLKVGTIKTSRNSARMVRCPVGRVSTASGTVPFAELTAGNPSRDVIMQLTPVEELNALTDGSIIYRVDAFEKSS